MGSVLIRQKLAAAKQLAAQVGKASSPFKKGELAEAFLIVLADVVEGLVDAVERLEKQGADNGQ